MSGVALAGGLAGLVGEVPAGGTVRLGGGHADGGVQPCVERADRTSTPEPTKNRPSQSGRHAAESELVVEHKQRNKLLLSGQRAMLPNETT